MLAIDSPCSITSHRFTRRAPLFLKQKAFETKNIKNKSANVRECSKIAKKKQTKKHVSSKSSKY